MTTADSRDDSTDDAPEWFRLRFTADHLDDLQFLIEEQRARLDSQDNADGAAYWQRMNEHLVKQRAGQGDSAARQTALRHYARDCLESTPADKRGDVDEAMYLISEYVGEYDHDADAVTHALEDAGVAREDRLSIVQGVEKGEHLRPPEGYRDA